MTQAYVLLGAFLAAAALCGCNSGSSQQTGSSPGAGGGGSAPTSSICPAMATPAACMPASSPGGPYCLSFVGGCYDVHLGEKFEVALVASDGRTVIQSQTIAALAAPAFYVNFPQVMQAGVPYYVDYYADNNRNGVCDPPPTDHVWRSHNVINFYSGTITTIQATAGDIVWPAAHDDPWGSNPAIWNTCAQLR